MDPVYTLMCAAVIALALRSVYRSVSEAQAELRRTVSAGRGREG